MSDEVISFNISTVKSTFHKTKEILQKERVRKLLMLLLVISIVIFGSWIRLQNLPLLKDATTEEYIPVALDPFYFLRIADTMIEQGGLPEFDNFRKPFDVPFTDEILPDVMVWMYKVASLFDKDVTIQFINVISPVVFFALGLFVFFFLIYFLTNSKIISLLSILFLAIMPPYLYRTSAGFSDHESIGMFAFFLVMLFYVFALKFLENIRKVAKKREKLVKSILFGSGLGFLTIFSLASWGGMTNFLFMIIPLSFGLFWILKTKNIKDKSELINYLSFYWAFFVSIILFGLLYGFNLEFIMVRAFLSTSSAINSFILLLVSVDFFVLKYYSKFNFIRKDLFEKYRILCSIAISMILGAILFSLIEGNPFRLFGDIIGRLLQPFGSSRVGLTVAENAQPSLNDWIGQIGKRFFWLFYLGMVSVGFGIANGIGQKKHKILFSLLWVLMISGVLFSRISSSSILNGTNSISKAVYFISLLLFISYSIWLFFNDRVRIKSEYLIIASWLLLMLIAGRGAIRLFFAITPFTVFMGCFFVRKMFDYTRKTKDDLLKIIMYILFAISVFFLVVSFSGLSAVTIQQAKFTGPSANSQWQNAMDWVKTNTPEDATFVHWWDYGYWVQYLGKRPVLADGGHFQGSFRDHLIGRYVLTTPNPNAALSFMKTNNVSYLLIDPTDLGKYPAYSRIGSDSSGEDRFSQLPVMILDGGQSQKTEEGERRIYQGGSFVDEDIVYNTEEEEIFLPANNAFIGGLILELNGEESSLSFNQPSGIFIYNGKQINLPIRYIHVNEQLIDFEVGLDAVIKLIPQISQNEQGVQIDQIGAAIYLSPKVKEGLFAQLYLMDDPFDNYPTITLVHSELDSVVKDMNRQGANFRDFVYFNGFRGPIKIWEVNYPENIIEKEEFLRVSGDYAEFDNLKFTR